MSKQTKLGIGWCHYTFNLWEGCWKISPGCENCYAEAKNAWLKRGEHWGRTAPRDFFKAAHYDQPLKWNDRAREAGERHRVFVGSVMDIMERHPIDAINDRMDLARRHLWNLIEVCESLDFLLLTKRIASAPWILPWVMLKCDPPKNVWLGVTAENQEYADRRIPILRQTPAYRRFVSYEPAIGPIDWTEHLPPRRIECTSEEDFDRGGAPIDAELNGMVRSERAWNRIDETRIHQVIFGDESGRKRRQAEEKWAEDTRDACEASDTAFYYKQWHGKDGKKVHLPVLDGKTYREFPAP